MARAEAKEEKTKKRKQKTMTGEEEEDTITPFIPKKPKKKKKLKKKLKKDKCGQPLPSDEAAPEELEQPEAAATAEEKEEDEQCYATKKRKQKTMTGEEEEDTITPSIPKKPKKLKKKLKKDKCGQPLLSDEAAPEEVEQPEAAATAEEKEEEEQCYATKKVVVSGMPYSTTGEEIRSFFEGAGNITLMRMSTFPDTGNFRGLAFLTFKTAEAASKSLELDGTNMGGRVVRVERCRLHPSKKKETKILGNLEKEEGYNAAYIGNLALDVTEDDIRAFLDQSKIESIRLAVNRKTGKLRGFGHIDFADHDSLEKAILKNKAELNGRPVKISYASRNKN